MIRVDAIRSSRVVVREMTRSDVDAMAEWPRFVEPDLQWANLDLGTPPERDAYFERGRSNLTRKRFVILARNGLGQAGPGRPERVLGTIGLRNIDYLAEEATLGIIVRADEVGHGYGTDAIRSVLGYAFDTLGLRRVLLDVAANNARARRCYEQIGFSQTGYHQGPGRVRYIDMVIYRPAFLLRERMR